MSKSKVLGLLTLLLVLPALGLAQKASKNMTPVLNAISPTSATAGGSSLTVTASGSNFTSGSVVQWNGSSLATTVVSSTRLQAPVASSRIASAGTATVKVYTSGRFGGTSNGLTFTIDPAPAAPPPPPPAPPPSPDPLSITTSSVPAGTAGSAYNTPLAASGGTPAYGWSKVSGGGDLPPGLALGADGKLSGTPTTGGTFSFTAQANDSSSTPQAAQKVFSLTVAAPPASGASSSAALFQTGFESGLPAGFDYIWAVNGAGIANSPVHSGTGAGRLHYIKCGDSTNRACGDAHQDDNESFDKYFNSSNGYPNGLSHWFMRSYVYLASPQNGGTKDGIQRKLLWIQGRSDTNDTWSAFLTSDSSGGAVPLRISNNGSTTCGVVPFSDWDVYRLNYDTWYALELEMQLNTPSAGPTYDGRYTLWVNGTQVSSGTGKNWRGTCSEAAGYLSFGRQSDRNNYDPIDEYRYWDDIVISTSYVGP